MTTEHKPGSEQRCEPQFTLYSRGYCHLCDDMLAELEALLAGCAYVPDSAKVQAESDSSADAGPAFNILVVDIDAASTDPALLARYDEKVPVLLAAVGQEEQELCHYFLDKAVVLSYLQTHFSIFNTQAG